MKKKVLVDLFYLNTALTGIKTYMLEFCAAVEENPHEEIEFIYTHDPVKQSEKSFFRGDVPYWRKLFYHLYYFWYKQVSLPFKIRSNNADQVICFDFVAPALNSTPALVVVHDAFFWQLPRNYNSIWRKYFLRAINWGLKDNTTVITTSNYSKKSIQQASEIQHNIEVIYQCPRLLPENQESDVLRRFNLRKEGFFLHVGSFDKRKMLPVLVKAFALFNQRYPEEFKLVLVGERGLSTSLDDFDNILHEIKKSRLESQVVLTGFLPDQSVKTLYQNAFSYVFPSSNEGFGIPVIEAMENKVPLIISDQEALVEIAGGAALISKVGDEKDLAEKMILLRDKADLRKELVIKGEQRRNDFSRKKFFLSFFKLLVKN